MAQDPRRDAAQGLPERLTVVGARSRLQALGVVDPILGAGPTLR